MKACKQIKLVEQEMNDLWKSGISQQQFQALMPLIITEERARLSQDGNQTTGIYAVSFGACSVPLHCVYYYVLCRYKLMEGPVLHSSV